MKKDLFYLASTGKPVTYGDVIKGKFNKDGICQLTFITLNEATVPVLLQSGIILYSPPVQQNKQIESSLEGVINRLAKRLGWKQEKVLGYLDSIHEIMPMAAFNILSREIAVMLDEKYPDHINNSEKIYCISPLDGRIHEICKAHIKNYRNFAAFRTLEDAKFACRILRDPLKSMFSGK